jgi:hypothetical protein
VPLLGEAEQGVSLDSGDERRWEEQQQDASQPYESSFVSSDSDSSEESGMVEANPGRPLPMSAAGVHVSQCHGEAADSAAEADLQGGSGQVAPNSGQFPASGVARKRKLSEREEQERRAIEREMAKLVSWPDEPEE